MSPETGKCSKIGHIVRVRQMLLRWRKKSSARGASDVPAGHVAVCVGPSSVRFIVRATYLNHPMFKKLLMEAEEEYGFCNQGPLTIPCDELLFQEALRVMSRSDSARFSSLEDFRSRCHRTYSYFDVIGESRPLLHHHPIC